MSHTPGSGAPLTAFIVRAITFYQQNRHLTPAERAEKAMAEGLISKADAERYLRLIRDYAPVDTETTS